MSRVLLLHGVNSTGEWHARTRAECQGVFECESIKYRHYHGWWGPVKVYIWPTALLLFLATMVGIACSQWTPTSRLLFIGTLVLIETAAVTWAEYEWAAGIGASIGVPIFFCVAGIIAEVIMWFYAAEQTAISVAILIAVLTGQSIFLDLREYWDENLSLSLAFAASILASLAAALGMAMLAAHPGNVPLAMTLAALGLAAIVEPWLRRAKAFQLVRRRLEEEIQHSPFPHVVAHSLGTYLTGHMLNEDEDIRFGRVLLTGCVLDRSFPWGDFLGPETRQACWEVRNYVGQLDLVPIGTGLLRGIWIGSTCFARTGGLRRVTSFVGNWMRWRPLGRAGQAGFRDQPAMVHSLRADIACPFCASDMFRAPVHNIAVRFGAHSTINRDPEYQRFRWLPCLWGDWPDKFDWWKENCRIGWKALAALMGENVGGLTEEETADYRTTLRTAERNLLAGPWYFPLTPLDDRTVVRGRGLRAYVQQIIDSLDLKPAPDVDIIMKRVPAFVFWNVAKALDEKKQPNGNKRMIALLEPRKALFAAVSESVRIHQAAALQPTGMVAIAPPEH